MIYPNIEFPGEKTFGNTQGVEHGSENVKETHQNKPTQRSLIQGFQPTFLHWIVDSRNDPT